MTAKVEYVGVDLANGKDKTVAVFDSRTCGKTIAMQKALNDFIRENPGAIIAEVTPEGVRIERPIV